MATKYQVYSKALSRAVVHIFNNLLDDNLIKETIEPQAGKTTSRAYLEFDGTLKGEIVLIMPPDTIEKVGKKYNLKSKGKKLANDHNDILGEIANLVTGTFANQLQFYNFLLTPLPPEFEEDPIPLKTLYENVSLSFQSSFGGFDLEAYLKDKK